MVSILAALPVTNYPYDKIALPTFFVTGPPSFGSRYGWRDNSLAIIFRVSVLLTLSADYGL